MRCRFICIVDKIDIQYRNNRLKNWSVFMRQCNTQEMIQEKHLERIEQSLKNLRIADLEIFITAVHMNNLGRSAQFHHLSQSAASAAIQRVESSFGLQLCTHEKRRFQLTKEGAAIFPRLEDWIRRLHLVVRPDELEEIRIVTSHAIAQLAVPSLLAVEKVSFKHMRPDECYEAVLRKNADLALVLDNFLWKDVNTTKIGEGVFQLFSKNEIGKVQPILLPEDQMEVLALKQSWGQMYNYPLPIKARIPSWSLIADICQTSDEVGFLPDFLGEKYALRPVSWQPPCPSYNLLAIYPNHIEELDDRVKDIIQLLQNVFSVT